MKNSIPSLKSSFFFTDKETIQKGTIEDVFSVKPTLCLYHMKQLIKRNIGESRRANKTAVANESEKKLMQLIDTHLLDRQHSTEWTRQTCVH